MSIKEFYLPISGGLEKYDASKYLDINNYYTYIASLIPTTHHEELGKIISIEAEINVTESNSALKKAEEVALISEDVVRDGELIVAKGNLITEGVHQKLVSLEDAYLKRRVTFAEGFGSFTGHIILTFLILSALMLYFAFSLSKHFTNS